MTILKKQIKKIEKEEVIISENLIDNIMKAVDGCNCDEHRNILKEFLVFHFRDLKLTLLKQLDKQIEDVLDTINLEIIFTDIKDEHGNKIQDSEELMKLFDIFWEHIAIKLTKKLGEIKL